jgi:hypothetical protein
MKRSIDKHYRNLTEEVTHILRLSPFYDSMPSGERNEFIYALVERYQYLFETVKV